MMTRILAIAGNSLRECLRNRVVFALLGVTALLMLASLTLGFVTPEAADKLRVLLDFNLSAIALSATFGTVFLGTSLIYQEVEKRTVYTLLARPLSRAEFLAGKYLGLVAVNAVNLLAMAALLVAFLLLNGYALPASLPLIFGGIFLELTVITGIALLLSVTAHPIEGALFSLVLCFLGHGISNLKTLEEDILRNAGEEVSWGTQLGVWGIDALYYVLPHLDNFNFRHLAANQLPVDGPALTSFAIAVGYALVYALLLYTLAVGSFARKQL